MSEQSNADWRGGEKRASGVRLRKYIDVVVEDRLSAMSFRSAIADISETGMRVISDQYLPVGTKYTFVMKSAPNLSVRGEVRWVRDFARNTYQAGIMFIDVAEEDSKRLASFLDVERRRLTTSG